MISSRKEQIQFLEEELKAQTESFKQKLDTSALFLLMEREELFIAQYLKFQDGEMILKFSGNRGLPRIGEFLYCFTVPQELRDYHNWHDKSYGDLIKTKDNYSECVCIWQMPSEDDGYNIAGFRGVDLEFSAHIQSTVGIILLLGPNKPPYEYLTNLQKITDRKSVDAIKMILDADFKNENWEPVLIDDKNHTIDFIKSQLELQDSVIIQGPPGTGKSFLIAQIIEKLANEGKSILVAAITNRALIEIAEKPPLKSLLEEERILKLKLSFDEARLYSKLVQANSISPQCGKVILSTFYIVSGQASQTYGEPPFDYVIMDESSQALLAMFAASKLLGKKNIWVGDINQLPPIVSLSEDIINNKDCWYLVDGLKALVDNSSCPVFQLTSSYRLNERAIDYTGIFYNNTLQTKSVNDLRLNYQEVNESVSAYLNNSGGPTLIKTDLEFGNFKPGNGVALISEITKQLLLINENIHISILSYFVETVKAIQKSINITIGYRKNLLIETVSRIQGLTTDICIFFIPNTSYHRSLEKRLFNVATSRSKRQTIIIADKSIINRNISDPQVRDFLNKLNSEFSFEI